MVVLSRFQFLSHPAKAETRNMTVQKGLIAKVNDNTNHSIKKHYNLQ